MNSSNRLTIFIGGTYSSECEESAELFNIDKSYAYLQFGKRTVLCWDGGNDSKSRGRASGFLAEKLFDPGLLDTPITIIGFSHGGNIAIEALCNIDSKYRVSRTKLVTIATPALEQYEGFAHWISSRVGNWLNIYSLRDGVQTSLAAIGPFNRLYNNGRTYGYSEDYEYDIPHKGRLSVHRALASDPGVVSKVREWLG